MVQQLVMIDDVDGRQVELRQACVAGTEESRDHVAADGLDTLDPLGDHPATVGQPPGGVLPHRLLVREKLAHARGESSDLVADPLQGAEGLGVADHQVSRWRVPGIRVSARVVARLARHARVFRFALPRGADRPPWSLLPRRRTPRPEWGARRRRG